MGQNKLEETLIELRKRMSEYRHYKIQNGQTSIHINAIEISLCLAEYALVDKQAIIENDKRWFEAGYQVLNVLENSEWENICELYFDLKSELIERKLLI